MTKNCCDGDCKNGILEKSKLKPENLEKLASFFKVFGDPTRIKILLQLKGGRMCVQHIAESLTMTQSAISHQLRILKDQRLVKNEKEGKTVFYSLDDGHIEEILQTGITHINHN